MKKKSEKVILPFRWAGGKYYALKKLSQFWENFDHDEYREPFLGGGSVFWAKEKVKFNWLNDVDSNLIKTLDFIRDTERRNSLLKLFENEQEATKEKYEIVKKMSPTSELDLVYKYYYLNRTSFSGKMRNPSWGYRPKRSLPPIRWHERLVPCGEKLQNVKLTNLDFEEVILAKGQGKKVLLFLDPPYFLKNQECHYMHGFGLNDHIRLADVCKKTKHSFFLTYDDCPEVRDLYKWANIYELEFFYRLDNSKDNLDKRKMGSEIVITNYTPNINSELLKHAAINI
jgi:DNA adenine methylase